MYTNMYRQFAVNRCFENYRTARMILPRFLSWIKPEQYTVVEADEILPNLTMAESFLTFVIMVAHNGRMIQWPLCFWPAEQLLHVRHQLSCLPSDYQRLLSEDVVRQFRANVNPTIIHSVCCQNTEACSNFAASCRGNV